MDNQKAFDWVEQLFKDTLPPGVPIPYKQITKAEFVKADFPTVHASLTLFDEEEIMIEVSKLSLFQTKSLSWKYKWLTGNGNIYWNDKNKEWSRDYIEC